MGIFTARERAQLDKSPPTPRMQERRELSTQARVHNSIRDELGQRRRPTDSNLGDHVGLLLQRATTASLREIDDLMLELRRRREELLSESTRVQNEIFEYAKLNQSTIDSTKMITERLVCFNRPSNATPARVSSVSPVREARSENIPSVEIGESRSAEVAQSHGEEETTINQDAENEAAT